MKVLPFPFPFPASYSTKFHKSYHQNLNRFKPITVSSFKASLIPPPPPDFDFRNEILGVSTAAIAEIHPELLELAQNGTLIMIRKNQYGPVPSWRSEFTEPESIWIVGTTHISQESASDVERIIRAVRPDNIVVELCRSRMVNASPSRGRGHANNATTRINVYAIRDFPRGCGPSSSRDQPPRRCVSTEDHRRQVLELGRNYRKIVEEMELEILRSERDRLTLEESWVGIKQLLETRDQEIRNLRDRMDEQEEMIDSRDKKISELEEKVKDLEEAIDSVVRGDEDSPADRDDSPEDDGFTGIIPAA